MHKQEFGRGEAEMERGDSFEAKGLETVFNRREEGAQANGWQMMANDGNRQPEESRSSV